MCSNDFSYCSTQILSRCSFYDSQGLKSCLAVLFWFTGTEIPDSFISSNHFSLQGLTLSLPCLPRRHSESDQQKCQISSRYSLSSPLHEHVKRFLSKCAVLKVDLLHDHQNMLFAGVYVCTFHPGNFTGWSSEGVKRCPQILKSLLWFSETEILSNLLLSQRLFIYCIQILNYLYDTHGLKSWTILGTVHTDCRQFIYIYACSNHFSSQWLIIGCIRILNHLYDRHGMKSWTVSM